MSEESKPKIRTICVDTLTAIQTCELMTEKKKPGYDQWRDFGVSIYTFMNDLQNLGFECILILSEPGCGKSFGQHTLKPNTNIWYNADNKNPTWEGGKAEYGKKTAPRAPYHVIPKTYDEIINHIKEGLKNDMFETDRYAFITGHTETYKAGLETKERLKILGKMATKMQLEGKMETVMYARVEMEDGIPHYILETQNNGYNTARSHQNMFDGKIANDYNMIVEKLLQY